MEQIIYKLKKDIIEVLNLDTSPEEIDNEATLFGHGLGLDSIDAIELIVLLDKRYNIKITQKEEARKIFTSIRTMAEYIQLHSK